MGVFTGFERHQPYTSGEVVEDVFLDDAADELVHLFRAAFGLYESALVY
jgi:hypothetical protein